MNAPATTPELIPWRAQEGPQLEAIRKHWVSELFFGGAVGGGKSDFLLGDFAQDVPVYGGKWHGILFRKSYPQLEELVARSKQMYPAWFGLDATKAWTSGNHMWTWPNGATLKFRHAEDDDSWMEYQGHQYPWMGYDELPHWGTPLFYRELKTRQRSALGIPNMRIRATGNPGGLGHGWIKQYWQIDKYPQGGTLIPKDRQGGTRMFIRSRVQDNKILMANDPEYIDRLRGLGSETLVQQYLDGNWNVIAGAYFPEFNVDKHVIKPFPIPKDWLRFCAMDWGSSTPFCVLWFAVSDGGVVDCGGGRSVQYPRGALVAYREWYGASQKVGEINVGLKMTAEEVAAGIIKREDEFEQLSMRVLDPSAFKEDSGPSIAERMANVRVGQRLTRCDFQRADNTRKGGWDMVRNRLKGEHDEPMIFFFETCPDTIRTLPMLQHDRGKKAGALEDVDTDSEDHCFAAGTLVKTPRGLTAIDKLPQNGLICTRFGTAPYRSAGLIGFDETLKLSFSDGSTVVCTPDHRFFSEDGWTEAKDLLGHSLPQWSSRISVKNFLAFATTAVDSIFNGKASGSTELFGNITRKQFLTDGMFTTPTGIEATTIRKTCACSKQNGICRCTAISKTKMSFVPDSKNWPNRKRPSGIDPKKVGHGIGSTEPITTFVVSRLAAIATSAGARIKRGRRALKSLASAARIANSARCVSVEPQQKQNVFCVTVPTTAEFLLSNGLAVSNCGDTVRYSCMARPWVPKSAKPEPQKLDKGMLRSSTTFNDLMEIRRRERMEQE